MTQDVVSRQALGIVDAVVCSSHPHPECKAVVQPGWSLKCFQKSVSGKNGDHASGEEQTYWPH